MDPFMFFEDMLGNRLGYSIDVIVWDLDCTLGSCPGWDGQQPVELYIDQPDLLRRLLEFIKNNYNARNVLVSNNLMFCGSSFKSSKNAFLTLGFDEIMECNRASPETTSKVARLKATNPARVLLIDDQIFEARKAFRDGSHVVQVNQSLFNALNTLQFELMFHDLT